MFRSGYRILALLFLVAVSCKDRPGPAAAVHLPGYWEITRVEFPDGNTRKYPVNTSVDFYHLEGKKGYRKRLQPNADGTFATSDDALSMELVQRNGGLVLRFQEDSGPWEEVVEVLNENELVTRHDNGLYYCYKRYTPITLDP